MNIIAFSGKRESGKTSCAMYLVNQFGAKLISFADALREELVALGYDKSIIYAKPTPAVIRNLLIAHGEARRYTDPDYWAKILLGKIAPAYVDGTGLVVIDDMRYVNEADKLRFHGATLVRVELLNRDDHVDFVQGVDDNSSETDLDDYSFDYHIKANHGQISFMHEMVEHLLTRINDKDSNNE